MPLVNKDKQQTGACLLPEVQCPARPDFEGKKKTPKGQYMTTIAINE
jgi:hypothetical protein